MGEGRGNQVTFSATVQQVISSLLHYRAVEPQVVGAPQHFGQLPAGRSGGADVADLAGTDQVVQRTQRLIDRGLG